MAYKEGEVFTSYCDRPYDRHTYKLRLKNGKSVVFDSYDLMKYHWYKWKGQCERVDILDATAGKGF